MSCFRIITVLVLIGHALACAGGGMFYGQHVLAGNMLATATDVLGTQLDKAIYRSGKGDLAADVTYAAPYATIREIVDTECRRAPEWSPMAVTYAQEGEDGAYIVSTAKGSTLSITLTEAGGGTTLEARIKTKDVRVVASQAESAGPSVETFGSVLATIAHVAHKRGIKIIEGGYVQKFVHGRPVHPARHRTMQGSRLADPDVRTAQSVLNQQGYDCGPADGIMGAETRRCIAEFQESEDLAVTGSLNAVTRARLRR